MCGKAKLSSGSAGQGRERPRILERGHPRSDSERMENCPLAPRGCPLAPRGCPWHLGAVPGTVCPLPSGAGWLLSALPELFLLLSDEITSGSKSRERLFHPPPCHGHSQPGIPLFCHGENGKKGKKHLGVKFFTTQIR